MNAIVDLLAGKAAESDALRGTPLVVCREVVLQVFAWIEERGITADDLLAPDWALCAECGDLYRDFPADDDNESVCPVCVSEERDNAR